MFAYIGREYGYTPREISKLTLAQVHMLMPKSNREVTPDKDSLKRLAKWRKEHEEY